MSKEYKIVGTRAPGMDEKDKVLGNVVFAEDFVLPGMLYAKVFRSTKPSARDRKSVV